MGRLSKVQAAPTGGPTNDPGAKRVQFRFHARALAALGRDLVTNDVVAVMELVKNSYDAMATLVQVRIRPGDRGYIEIIDNGHGMNYATIRDVWCVVATPLQANAPCVERRSAVSFRNRRKGTWPAFRSPPGARYSSNYKDRGRIYT